jgi:hypothetical protein
VETTRRCGAPSARAASDALRPGSMRSQNPSSPGCRRAPRHPRALPTSFLAPNAEPFAKPVVEHHRDCTSVPVPVQLGRIGGGDSRSSGVSG